jgi:drug/metabolite transporter (DMT)-like permease
MLADRPWLAFGLIFLVATSFAFNSTSAGVAYTGGSDALSVLATRSVFAVLALFVFMRLRGVPMRLPPRERRIALALGVPLGLYSYGLLGAIEYIPVALAVLTFYTYPLLTGIVAWLTGQERMTVITAGALVAAFAGLALALDITGGGLNWIGFGLAGFAAVTVTALLILTSRLVGTGGDSRPMTLHMLTTAAIGYVVVAAVRGDFALPETETGWLGFAGVPVFYTFSIIGFFVAAAVIGAVKTSMVMNFEPVASMVLGFLILEQRLAPTQILGAALVVAAILVVRSQSAPKPAEET